MKDLVTKLLTNTDSVLLVVALVVIGLNILLTALKKIVDLVKDKTAVTWDNALSDTLGKILGGISKVLEFASANSNVLPPKTRAEIEAAASEKAVAQVLAIPPAEAQDASAAPKEGGT